MKFRVALVCALGLLGCGDSPSPPDPTRDGSVTDATATDATAIDATAMRDRPDDAPAIDAPPSIDGAADTTAMDAPSSRDGAAGDRSPAADLTAPEVIASDADPRDLPDAGSPRDAVGDAVCGPGERTCDGEIGRAHV